MMKKSFLTITMVFLGLFAMVNNSWGQIDLSGIDMEDPATWFYVRLNADVSNPGCGTTTPGKVYLIFTNSDDARTPMNPWITGPKPSNPYEAAGSDDWNYRQWSEEYGFAQGSSDAQSGNPHEYPSYYDDPGWTSAAKEGYDAGWNWYTSGHALNAANPTGLYDNTAAWSTSASLKGYAMIYAPGFDDLMGISAYAYFFGKAAENDGWYFTGWSFTEGESDLGGTVGTADSLQFRILPSSNAGEENIRDEHVYATFRPVMVSNYKVNGLINTSVSNTTTVVFDAVGQRVSAADFTVSVPEADFSAVITSCVDNKVTVTVTYSGTTDGEFRGNVKLASKSGCSELTAPVYARVGGSSDAEAILYDGKTPTSTSGTLDEMIAAADGTDKIVVLNKSIAAATNINAAVTINFNGYSINNTMTVDGGEVTVAYSKYGGGANALAVMGGKAVLNGGEFGSLAVGASGMVEQNGASFTAASSNSGSLTTTEGRFEAGLTSGGTLVINGGVFEGATAIAVTGGTATINKAAVSGTTYGIQTSGGTTNITSKLVSVYGATNAVYGNGGTVNINNGKYESDGAPLAGTVNLQAGYFKVDGEHLGVSIPSGKNIFNVLAGAEFAAGYRYFVGDDASSVGVCRIGTTSYATLEDALAYANNTGATVTIIMTNDYTMPAGYYTLPANATLIIPMSNEQETGYEIINRVSNNSASGTPYVTPTEFRRLTLAKGVNLDVYGLIEVTGTQRASDDAYATLPHGPYGRLVMNEGSRMTLQNASELRVWGYMTGMGETDARRGSVVREQFQMGDWKGGGVSFSMLGAANEDKRVFPITQYYIQNIESPVKYHPGSVLSTTTSVSANFGSMGMTAMANDIKVVGVSGQHTAMFLMDNEADAENTWVRKWYDAEHDVQTYEVNSGAHLGSMVLDLGKLGTQPLVMNSGYFVLPITNNMKIHLLSGMMDFTQTTSLLPGAEVEVDKESVIKIVQNADPSVYSGSLYVYDADDWSYAGGKGDAANKFYTKVVPYSPSFDGITLNGKPNKRSETTKPADAKINVHGSFDTGQGAVYTTPGGANIFSSNEDAGTFIFSNAAPSSSSDVYQYINGSGYTSVAASSAQLRNGDGSLTSTEGTNANQVFIYKDDTWASAPNLLYFDCYTAEIDMTVYAQEAQKKAMKELSSQPVTYDLGAAVSHIYIKPQEWVEIVGHAEIEFDWSETPNPSTDPYNPYLIGVTGNDDHTFSDAAGAGRLFILMDKGCQWWEVEKKDNLYHCIHPDNDTYYYWGEDPTDGVEKWLEKKFTISWKNWDGTPIATNNGDALGYEVTYGTIAEFLGSNPTREATMDYTYDFTGWTPALGPVTSDVTYTATYEQKERKYTIIFLNEGGTEIERHFLTHNEMPSCENVPTRIGYTLQWDPAIAAVTGDATYTATWLEEPHTEYEVTFFDYNGTTILQQGNVNVGVVPTPPANPTGKADWAAANNNKEFTYVFDHWSPALEEVSATSAKTYTAVYREVEQTYTISYYKEDGSTLITTEELPYGATPTPPVVSKENPETGHTYTLVWKNLAGTATIQTVMEPASYKPTYIDELNKYTVTVKSNPSGACSSTGAGLYYYNTSATLTLSVNEGYTFTGWSDGLEGTNTTRTITVTEDKELVANFTVADPDWTITWKSEDGSANLVDPVGQKANTATVYTGATPTKDATAAKTFTFYGWSTGANGAGTIYKNGLTPKATANATYYAYFNEEARKYTISWKNENGMDIEVDYDQPFGAAIAFNSATPTKKSTTQYTYAFDGWSTSAGGSVVALPATVSGEATFYAHFAATTNTYTITWLRDDGSLIDRTEVAYGVVPTHADPTKAATAEYTYTFTGWDVNPVAVTGIATYTAQFSSTPVGPVATETLEAGIGATVEAEAKAYASITITSNGTSSGQITNAGAIISCENAYFDLVINAQAKTWYAVAVPWQVDATNGIIINNTPQRLGVDIDVLYYDGANRAAYGKGSNWLYLEYADDKTMQPGTFYMIYLAKSASAIRFQKKAGTALLTTNLSVEAHPQSTGNDEDAGWNGIANPALFHAYIDASSKTYSHTNFGQKYIPSEKRYNPLNMASAPMIVGEPIFVQVSSNKNITVATSNPFHAPARRAAVDNSYYEVQISAGEEYTDRVYLQTMEGKEDRYVIELDLAKAGISTQVAQMWVDRYNTQLCVNTTAPVGKTATYPLGISIPETGTYQISSATPMQDNQELYVTRNGKAIWNLAYGPYTVTLDKGTYSEYGIKLIQSNAPATTTGVGQTSITNDQFRKVLIDNKVYIIREGALYTITGQKVN
ncbi:MAG: hypothetical protein II825_09760 [Paludibacteraceae bacterium]|nr:hypothetical protein [Paludibacteraceae bacterium]